MFTFFVNRFSITVYNIKWITNFNLQNPRFRNNCNNNLIIFINWEFIIIKKIT